MANIKISDLTSASAAADANEFEINEAGTSKKVTGSQIKAYVNAGDGALAAKNTVATADIDNLAVTTAKLAADAVDGTKIANDAIDSEHIAADSIDAEHYAPGSVDSTAIASNAVGADEINVTGNGTSGQYLASDGDGTMTWTDLPAGGGFSNLQVFTSPGTWTNPGDVEKVKVTVIGGGGGGASFPGPNGLGSGGGGGGAAIEVISFPSATNVPVTVGGGGSPVGPTASGGTGGTSSFGAYCSASGGQGGQGNNRTGGNGGIGSGGNLNLKGAAGDQYRNANLAGHGGPSYLGGGGLAGAPNGTSGSPGGAYGGGGGGGTPSGAGSAGVVIVEY
jgi:hypothetical protein